MQKPYFKYFAVILLCCVSFCVKGAVHASFSIDNLHGCSPFLVNFTNTSSGATSYYWDFGNGNNSTLTDPSASYVTPGTYTVVLTAYDGLTSDTESHTITVDPDPILTFTGTPTAICPGGTVAFTSTVIPGVSGTVTYVWNFGDGNTGTGVSPTHTYYAPYGYKNVTLTATNSAGCDNTISNPAYINVYTPASINFIPSATTFCTPPATVTFTNTTTGYGTLTYAWDFGDGGGVSYLSSPTHTYTVAGNFTVRLICTDGHGCSDTLIQPNLINVGNFAANFTFSNATCLSTPISFTNTSSAHTYTAWDFGDASASLLENPSHTYYATGTYNVRLIVASGSCTDTVIQAVAVHNLPAISATSTPSLPCPAPQTTHYISAVPGGSTVTWFFSGVADTGITIDHTYTSNGSKYVFAIVTDTNGCLNHTGFYDTLYDGVLTTSLPLQICLGTNYHYYFNLKTYVFSSVGSTYPYSIASVSWNFGDGTISAVGDTYHTYAALGTYVATCTVTTVNGCVFTMTRTVVVTNDPPTATFVASSDTVCYGVPITFTATLTHGPVDGYQWYFHDDPPFFGGITGGAVITHVFNYPGVFDVVLSPFYQGCASATHMTIVVDSPKAIIGVKYKCTNRRSALFIDSSMGDNSHVWIFPDATTSTADTVSYTFPALGTYTVTLATYNSRSGCRDTARRVIKLYDTNPAFSVSDTTLCYDPVALLSHVSLLAIYGDTGNRIVQYSVVQYGLISQAEDHAFNYYLTANPGISTVSVVTLDNHGCYDTTTRNIYCSNPIAHFVTTPFCAGQPDPFTDSSSHYSFAGITNYYWTFGDGATASVATPVVTHYYSTSGTFTVSERITDAFGCTSTAYRVAHIWHPTATISMLPYPCKNIVSHFSYSSADTIVSTSWNFGDLGTSTSIAPTHTYTDTGIYNVRLVVTDNHGCRDTVRQTIHITVPHASFVCDTFLVCDPFRDTFISTSTGASSYLWSFGDGGSSAFSTAPTTYISPGIYTARLIAFTANGCSDTATQQVRVFGFSGDFTYPDSGCAPLSVHFSAGLLNVDSVQWDFGDGIVSPYLFADTTTHVYLHGITHQPRLIIYKNGCQGFSNGNDSIKVDTVFQGFMASDYSVCKGSPITFTDTSTSFLSVITNHHWFFDDGGSSFVNPVVHSFTSTDTVHTITVVTTDGWGCSSSKTDSVTIYQPPIISVIGSIPACIGGNIQLYDTVTGGTPGYIFSWAGPAGYTSTAHNPLLSSVTTLMNGWYRLTVTDAHGCTAKDSVNVTAYNPTNFSVSGDTSICIGLGTNLSAMPSTGMSFIWSPATGLSCVSCPSPFASPVVTTTYRVVGTNTYGCKDTVKVTVIVNSLPVIGEIKGNTTICLFGTSIFTNTPTGGSWVSEDPAIIDFGGSPGLAIGISVGTTILTYTVTDVNGCINADTILATVVPLLTIPPITGDSTVCVGSITVLHDSLTGGIWVTEDSAIAYVDSFGVVTTVGTGITDITYSVIDSNGCPSYGEDFYINVLPLPVVPAISMVDTICVSELTALVVPIPGGIWTSSDSAVAIPGVPPGFVAGISVGLATLTYTVSDSEGCVGYATHKITVIPHAVVGPISAPDTICIANDITYATDSVPGGIWSVSDTSIAIIDSITGHINGMSGGTVIITYTVDNGYCQIIATDTMTILSIYVAPIVGDTAVCIGQTTVFTDSTTGGFWVSVDESIAAIDSYGLFTGIDTGHVLIGYVVIDYAHLCLGFDTALVYVAPYPVIPPFVVPDHLCIGDSAMLSDTLTGGTWSSSDTSIAITSGDYVIGVSAGTVAITYSYTNLWGCSAFIVSDTIIILSLPDAGTITGYDTLCLGGATLLSETVSPGVWSSLDPTIAAIDAFGVVTGLSLGSAVIRYHVVDSACGNNAYDTVYVITVPAIPPIIGADSGCIGTMYAMTDSLTGGTWYIIDGATSGTIDPVTGEFTAVHPGHVIIGYTVTTYCGDVSTTHDIWIIPPAPPIGGIRAVCSGSTTNLYNFIPGGVWSSENPAIANVDPVTGVVTGIATGTTTITYTATSICGTFTVTALVMVNMAPFITTNFIVACQDLGNGEFGTEHVIADSSGCILVCDSSVLRYYAHGVAGSSYTWTITGGNIITNYGDSIDVFWPSAGTTGSVTVYDTFSHCIGSATACIKVIHKPHALFSASSISVCLNGSIVFSNLSTGDSLLPITTCVWDFGDGTGSTLTNPSHTYTDPGTHQVTLIVRNACNCTDTFRITITVDNIKGAHIYCPSIVCENETITYNVSNDCGPIWSINGGTILSGDSTNTITVKWDNLGPDNFGYVSMSNTCGACADTTSMKVPVIELNAAIRGQDTVCINEIYQYELPLWGGTEYMWGVLGSSASVVAYRDDHKVLVRFTTPGTYVIHGWYQNIIKRCGGNVDKTIVAVEPDFIIGDSVVCSGTVGYYTAASSTYSDWTITNPSGVMTAFTHTPSISPVFSTPGYYTITAYTGFCIKPFIVFVADVPPSVDTVLGKDTVCLNRIYTYSAFADATGAIYNWQAIGGVVSPASGSPVVNVIWTSSGIKQLIVNRISTVPPYCVGSADTIDIIQEVVPTGITGDTTPCVNSTRTYSINYTRGEVYEWTIMPDSVGSVVSGNHGATCSVLWNNVLGSPTAKVVLTVRKCDSVFSDTAFVHLHGTALALSCTPNPACPNTPIVFHATAGDSAYVWNFGDGTPIQVTSSDSVSHAFPANTSSGNINYTILITAIPGTSGNCAPTGSASIIVPILPGPVAYASSATTCIYPPETIAAVGTVTNNITATSYQWYGTSGALGTATTQSITDTGVYYFIVVADNGCMSVSNNVWISYCGDSGGCASTYVPTVSSSSSCNTISVIGDAGAPSPYWSAAEPPVSSTSSGVNATYTYDVPGIYRFAFNYTGCHKDLNDTIPFVPSFDYRFKCAVGGIDSVFISDRTAYLPWVTLSTISWTVDGIPAGTGNNITQLLPALSTHTVVETVTTSAGTCTRTKVITLPARPHVSFTDTVVPICSGVPVQFIATDTAGIISYHWDFGDFSNIVMRNPQRTFTYLGPSPNFQNFQVTLSVTDSFGCTADTTQGVQIFRNQLHDRLMDSIIVCSDETATLLYNALTPSFPTYLAWSTGTTSYYPIVTENVLESGSYWVTLFDNYRCRLTPPTEMVKILHTPTAEISGRESYCLGDDVALNGFAGLSNTYQWYVDGTPQATTPFIRMPGLPEGNYVFQLVVGATDTVSNVTCYDTSAVHIIQVHRVPVPVIDTVLVDCSQYHIQLHATDSSVGTFRWSNGTMGATTDIYNGGPYRVWFTDERGCEIYADAYIPKSPEYYFQYLPAGCYKVCTEQLPITLYGPPHIPFPYWEWQQDGAVVASGSGMMDPFTIVGDGAYQWLLKNGLCEQVSDPMEIEIIKCASCDNFIKYVGVSFLCDTSAASYSGTIDIIPNIPGITFNIGTESGPINPFSDTLAMGLNTLSITFTTFDFGPPSPSSVVVEIEFTLPNGQKCFKKIKVKLPDCTWIEERGTTTTDSSNTGIRTPVATAMMVFPNPASQEVNISYDYGSAGNTERTISVYDQYGRKLQETTPDGDHGSWKLNTGNWTPGMYIIRMEGDGKTLQTQRLIVSN